MSSGFGWYDEHSIRQSCYYSWCDFIYLFFFDWGQCLEVLIVPKPCHCGKGCQTQNEQQTATVLNASYKQLFAQRLCFTLTKGPSKTRPIGQLSFIYCVPLRKVRSHICWLHPVQSRCCPDKDFLLLLQYRPTRAVILCSSLVSVPKVKQMQTFVHAQAGTLH